VYGQCISDTASRGGREGEKREGWREGVVSG